MIWMFVACVTNREQLQVPVVGEGVDAELGATDGGSVHLDEARVHFTDLRLEEPNTETAWSWSPVATAYAHPGHDYPGAVAGELLGDFELDLLGDDADLGSATCYEGRFATGRVHLAGECVVLAGVHVDDAGVERPFRFEVSADQAVVGLPFPVTMRADAPPASVRVGFDASRALAFVDWSGQDEDGDGVLTIADGTYGNTVTFGAVSSETWWLALDE